MSGPLSLRLHGPDLLYLARDLWPWVCPMRRREFMTLLGGAAAAWPIAARAQGLTVPLVGFLNSASPGPFARLTDAFRQGLRVGGYVEGRNVRIEYRWAEGEFARLPELAADLVHRRVSVIVATGGTVSARAAKEASATIPILFIVGPNPIGDGLVTSLNRPSGNATGVALYTSDLLPKRLELLEKLLPRAARIAVLINPNDAAHELETKYVEDAMRVTGQQMVLLKARRGNLSSSPLSSGGPMHSWSVPTRSSRSSVFNSWRSRHATPYPQVIRGESMSTLVG